MDIAATKQCKFRLQTKMSKIRNLQNLLENQFNIISESVLSYRMKQSQLDKIMRQTTKKHNMKDKQMWIYETNVQKLFKGSYHNFENVMNKIENGNTLYVFNDFMFSNEYVLNKDIQIIGVGC
eukprot:244940_1